MLSKRQGLRLLIGLAYEPPEMDPSAAESGGPHANTMSFIRKQSGSRTRQRLRREPETEAASRPRIKNRPKNQESARESRICPRICPRIRTRIRQLCLGQSVHQPEDGGPTVNDATCLRICVFFALAIANDATCLRICVFFALAIANDATCALPYNSNR
jgi:hypothetical protein